ncbi:MAG: inorganic diphosphatase [Candidatus Eremiobacteraeota bacterium]|nr:inorganic diphosphatase [Candidatus Eremiobacteraeota bacterium]
MSGDPTAIPWDRKGVELRVVVETPRGSRYKYAYEPKTRALELRFLLARGLSFPYDYGFVPQTRADDGDPADVVLMMEEPVLPLTVVRARLIGGFEMAKDGVRNDRLLACPAPMAGIATSTDQCQSIGELPQQELEQLERFLREYAEEQGHAIELRGRYDAGEALALVKHWHKEWKHSSCDARAVGHTR